MDSFKKGLQELNAGLNRAVRTLDRMLKAIEASEKTTADKKTEAASDAEKARAKKPARKPAVEKPAPKETARKKPATGRTAAKKAPARKTARKATAPKTSAPSKTAAEKAAAKSTDTEKVVGIIRRSRKGVDISTLMKKTGFDRRKIHNLTHKAAKQGKIEQLGKGVYAKGRGK